MRIFMYVFAFLISMTLTCSTNSFAASNFSCIVTAGVCLDENGEQTSEICGIPEKITDTCKDTCKECPYGYQTVPTKLLLGKPQRSK
jgi:hypothetical protein